MTRPGRKNSAGLLALQVGALSVNWTNLSIRPPLTACCSGVYPWSWSQVTAWACVRRWGLYSFGLAVSSGPTGPLGVILEYRPFTRGVRRLALKVLPSVLAANG